MGVIVYPRQLRYRIDAASPRLADLSNDLEKLTDLSPHQQVDRQAVDLLTVRPASAEQGSAER